MEFIFSKSVFSNLWFRSLIYFSIALLLIIIQISFLSLISIEGFLPDLLLIFIVWISLFEGRFFGLISAFVFGLLFDIFSEDILGSNALIKSIVAFFAGSFFHENKIKENLSGIRFLIVVPLAAIINNFIYYLIYLDLSNFSLKSFFVQDIFASTVYTTVISLIPMLFSSRLKNDR